MPAALVTQSLAEEPQHSRVEDRGDNTSQSYIHPRRCSRIPAHSPHQFGRGPMKAFVRICVAASLFASGIAVAAEPTAFKFEKLAEGVYFGMPNLPGTNNDNVLVVVGDNDVLMVDGGAETATAKKLQADVATLTNKPIKRLVNTHFHFDHAGGNEAYAPDVQIITSAYTAERLKGNPYAGHTFQNFFGPSGAQTKTLADLEANVGKETDA